jgi:hypothetical protein
MNTTKWLLDPAQIDQTLAFPGGAKVNDKSGLLEGEYKDPKNLA